MIGYVHEIPGAETNINEEFTHSYHAQCADVQLHTNTRSGCLFMHLFTIFVQCCSSYMQTCVIVGYWGPAVLTSAASQQF
jgi:hypothetical protein